MAQGDKGRVALKLPVSICTDNPTGTDIYPPGSPEAQHVENTGIERQGGLTPVYEQETTFATAGANSIITDSGDLLQVDASNNVRLNDVAIGNVGSLAVYSRGNLKGYIDAVWSADDTILAISRNDKIITLYEITPATLSILHSRTITFATLGIISIRSVTFVRYVDMHYADNQEFIACYFAGGSNDSILKESGLTVTQIVGAAWDQVNFAHRFAVNKYVFGMQNGKAVANPWRAGDILAGGGGANTMTNAVWCVIHRYRGTTDSRALFTFPFLKDAGNNLSGSGWVGYDGSGVYTGTITNISALALGAVTVTLQNQINAPGYSEATFTRSDTGTNIYSICYPGDDDSWYNGAFIVRQTQTQTPINGYGKISNLQIAALGNSFSLVNWRLIMTNGIAAMLSAVECTDKTNAESQDLGVPMTQNGEFDVNFVPHCIDTATYSRIIYSYLGVLRFIDIRTNAGHAIERISATTYRINALCPLCIVDTLTKDMHMGPNDYNGRIRWISTAAITTTTKISSIWSSPYANSLDTGDKLVTQTTPFTSDTPFACSIPTYWSSLLLELGNIYVNDIYSLSFNKKTNLFVSESQVGTLYVPDTRQPVAVGYHFGDHVVQSDFSTIFTGVGVIGSPDVDYGYVGYESGNESQGTLVSFTMFEQRYLFDGFDIFSVNFAGPIFTGTSRICPAPGLQFIAASPIMAYFFSAFDNSIYIFDGGRSLTKMHRLNDIRNSAGVLEAIQNGVYNVGDGTLLMQTAGSFIWVRDSVISQTYKKANQTGLTLYDTQQGIQIANNTLKWRYTFSDIGGTTVVPFVFQSAYFGPGNNTMMVVNAFDVTIHSPSKAATQVTLTYSSIDADGAQTQTPVYLTINPGDWSALGIYRCRLTPQALKVVAASIGVQCATKIVLTEVAMEWTEDVPAVPANSRSV